MLWQLGLRLRCWLIGKTLWPEFVDRCNVLQRTQSELLIGILKQNQDTEFGRRNRFDQIDSIDSYRSAVPIASYADLEPALVAQRESGGQFVVADQPVYYAITSGTSSSPKFVPITKSMLLDHRRLQSLALLCQLRSVPGLYDGKILAFMSPQVEERTKLGVPAGSLSGLLFQNSSRLVASRFSVPYDVFSIASYKLRQILIALFGMLDRPITAISAVNPSTLIQFERFLQESGPQLADLLREGSLMSLGEEAAKFEQRFLRLIGRTRKRVELIDILSSGKRPLLGRVFPDVLGITTWLGGNCGFYARKLPDLFVNDPVLLDAGYIASEFRGSVAVEPNSSAGVPTLAENFFEFISVNDWERGNRETMLLHQVEDGECYYIIATTKGGLYRYFINDIVQVEGELLNVPSIKFVQKGAGVTSITGEKLYEQQAVDAVERSSRLERAVILDFMFVADLEAAKYRFYFEGQTVGQTFAERLDLCLGEVNLEYAAKRKSERLNRIEVIRLKSGAFEARKEAFITTRGREGQYKAAKLLTEREKFFDPDDYVSSE